VGEEQDDALAARKRLIDVAIPSARASFPVDLRRESEEGRLGQPHRELLAAPPGGLPVQAGHAAAEEAREFVFEDRAPPAIRQEQEVPASGRRPIPSSQAAFGAHAGSRRRPSGRVDDGCRATAGSQSFP